ncbi:glycoside hydrolase family 1 protein [Psychromonas aquimarina]|uniref:glycoside hydrolase family 1 protein n=1 Tax=Psychromonas aquimarina TaxID=444919 RepID=UPI00040B4108|nr:glycoside hydrolase family 1 protein [Psychromonas aquimarina]
MSILTFPTNFWWGSASSGPQAEGAADKLHKNIWDHWFEEQPECFFDGVGPELTSGFYQTYKDDIALLKQTGHNSFRTSIQWSRLIRNFETGEICPKAVTFYNNVIDELLAQGIEPFINLAHFDMPVELQERGGWENKEICELYALYAGKAFALFGDRVKYWFTFNEPLAVVECGYIRGWHYPCVQDYTRAVQVQHNMIYAQARAIEEYRKSGKQGKIGSIMILCPTYARDENNPEDVKAKELAELLFNRPFLDCAIDGRYPQELLNFYQQHGLTPDMSADELKVIAENKIDILGVNYYSPRRVKAKETPFDAGAPLMPESFFDEYDWPEKKINPHRGWEIYEQGVYDLLTEVKNRYHNIECFISENGMGVEGEAKFRNAEGIIEDGYRIEFIKDHLRWVHKAIEEGVNCRGYHLWTAMDNWSWTNAYKNRYGFVEVDIKNGLKKRIKKSGRWFKTVQENNGF